ncbi:hypothetical protein PPL_10039 [Heterostelium album PN500]|uniref:Uncharacterized protein n=1 Tax=Heterostelium pallidum (strain ATCC 26659 / Pp 5 / PN500) TaxID=670386 RepID=D3BQ58_HETP5|nr:hypothetical protein PPL_10039 [Heterostelium album PN500]EFA76278.1 hypothetical protein PPL_10039 [Heterostelium album PN500]|eukprot:XP_020428410.1 hypothetical protein PPL_10039 [Heterostelium album PN500]
MNDLVVFTRDEVASQNISNYAVWYLELTSESRTPLIFFLSACGNKIFKMFYVEKPGIDPGFQACKASVLPYVHSCQRSAQLLLQQSTTLTTSKT